MDPVEQRLVNKMILDETIKHKRNLAKLTQELKQAVEHLTRPWATNLTIRSGDKIQVSDLIAVFKYDSLSMLLFVLALNPLSFLLKRCRGYRIGELQLQDLEFANLLFVEDLNLNGI